MKDTGKKLTAEEIAAVRDGTPMHDTPQEHVHRLALAHGLPEITGYYGADLRDGTIYEI